MSIRFSRVKAMTNEKSALFLVSGIPQSQADLEGWTAFQEFVADLKENECITVCVETFIYGEGETLDATPEEIAYLYMRISSRSDFIETRTEKVSEFEVFIWLKK